MNGNLNVKILESYVEIDKINDDINNKIFNFITKANELVELSEIPGLVRQISAD